MPGYGGLINKVQHVFRSAVGLMTENVTAQPGNLFAGGGLKRHIVMGPLEPRNNKCIFYRLAQIPPCFRDRPDAISRKE